MKLLKILAWIVFFPFMLTYWGWTKKNKAVLGIGVFLSVWLIVFASISTENPDFNHAPDSGEFQRSDETVLDVEGLIKDDSSGPGEGSEGKVAKEASFDLSFEGYTWLEVDGGDLSGDREPNVVVDIGFGDREYYAFTNEYGQLVKVIADRIVLQDEKNEPVLESGRYYPDEAKVPGTESPTLDEGHVIADSLGGVANAYNITPQDHTLNQEGDQAYMEERIRLAGGCTDFVANINYPNTETQIPSRYEFTYILNGKVFRDEFDNVNPDMANRNLIELDLSSGIQIIALDKRAEYIIIENMGNQDVDLDGWVLVSERGSQTYTFEQYMLKVGSQVKIGGYDARNQVDLIWEDNGGVWNNSKTDPASLYDAAGVLVSRYED